MPGEVGAFLRIPKDKRSKPKRVGYISDPNDPEQGYVYLRVRNALYREHILVWYWFHKEIPVLYIDHIDGDKTNNRIENLRLATNQENQRNRGPSKRNTSGYKGVLVHPKKKGFSAKISISGKSINLGYFTCVEDAATAYNFAAYEHFGKFAYFNTAPQPWLNEKS